MKPSTEAQYLRRYRDLCAAAQRETGASAPLSAPRFVDWLIDTRRPTLAPRSWRLYRASVVFVFDRLASAPGADAATLRSLVARLKATMACLDDANGGKIRKPRTSATKAKRLPPDDFTKITLQAHVDGAKHAGALGAYLASGRLTGLRPVEWAGARLVADPTPAFKWALIAPCAKHDDKRAHSETRTLYFESLPPQLLRELNTWLAIVKTAVEEGSYERLLDALSALMLRLTRKLFPRRRQFPTLYSTRHEAAARFKAVYVESQQDSASRLEGAAIVATLLGHACDETASRHYGRPNRRGGFATMPAPRADPDEVARVRRQLEKSLAKMRDQRSPTPPSP